MLSENRCNDLKKQLDAISKYANAELVSRPDEWGSINFEKAQPDIDLALSIGRDLLDLPVEFLTEGAAGRIIDLIPNVAQCLDSISEFSIEGRGDPGSNRDHLCGQLHKATEQLQEVAGPAIPYLAYRRGDVTENISKLESTLSDARKICDDAEKWVTGKKAEIEDTVRAAREAAASVGVATFTQEFDQEATALNKQSKKWLWATGLLSIATVVVAVGSYFWPSVSAEAGVWETLRYAVSKVTVIAVFFTSTVWCVRIYRALSHQATVNKHRALSLKTFRAFVEATEDEYVRDAVLMAATKAVFGPVSTGLVDQKTGGEEPAVNFYEFGKPATKNLGKAQEG